MWKFSTMVAQFTSAKPSPTASHWPLPVPHKGSMRSWYLGPLYHHFVRSLAMNWENPIRIEPYAEMCHYYLANCYSSFSLHPTMHFICYNRYLHTYCICTVLMMVFINYTYYGPCMHISYIPLLYYIAMANQVFHGQLMALQFYGSWWLITQIAMNQPGINQRVLNHSKHNDNMRIAMLEDFLDICLHYDPKVSIPHMEGMLQKVHKYIKYFMKVLHALRSISFYVIHSCLTYCSPFENEKTIHSGYVHWTINMWIFAWACCKHSWSNIDAGWSWKQPD